MDLYSQKDKILLKNCIIIKIKQIKLEEQKPNANVDALADSISYYSNLYEILKMDDTETLIATINDSIKRGKFIDFNEHIIRQPAQDFAEEYLNITKSLMKENGVYSQEKFEELKRAFYKGNENLLKTVSYDSLEEEPSSEADQTFNHLTDEMKTPLTNLQELFKQNTNWNTLTPSGFKNFSLQLKEITKNLAKCKLEQAYKKEIDERSLEIQYDTTARPTYRISLSLKEEPRQVEQLEVPASTSGFIATPFQNLCYTYLEAQKYSTTDESLLDSSIISEKMLSFRNSYKLLEETMSKFCFTISDGHIIPKDYTSYIPTKDELSNDSIACNTQEDTEISI